MSKKSRKKRLRQRPKKTVPAVRESSTSSSRDRVVRVQTDFQPDYTYVIKDLKRIGLLAGSFVTILVVLSFFLR